MMKNTREIETGINGRGEQVWIVITTNAAGRVIGREVFDNEAEAISWVRWA